MIALALPLLPLLGAAALLALRRRTEVLGPVAVGALMVTLALGVWVAAAEPAFSWRWSPTIRLSLAVDGFARVMVVLIPLIAVPIVAYAAATEEEGLVRLLALMIAFVGAMLLLVAAADLLTLLIAWEMVGATSWALIGHDWRDLKNLRSGAQAFITTRVGDLGLYLAAGISFSAIGSFTYVDLGAAGRPALDVIAAGVLVAAAAKSAQLPFSPWLFSAMAGPTPVSALLHSATLVSAGAYLLIRIAPAFEAVGWFLPAVAGIGLATALAGGLVALIQTDAKRVLAGSTSAQYGLMFVAVGALSTAASGAHLVAHAAFKSLLFLGAGVAIHAAGVGRLANMRLGRALPRVAALSLVGALALAAVPPLGAAWTKEQITTAAAHVSPWLAACVFGAGFLSALYAARYHLLAYGPENTQVAEDAAAQRRLRYQPGRVEIAGLAVLGMITLLLSLLWIPSAKVLVEETSGGQLFESALWELAVALGLIGAAFALAWRLLRRGRLVTLGLPAPLQEGAGDWLGMPTAARLVIVDPVLALSRLLRRFDDSVIDAGVRGAAIMAASVSRLFSRRAEWTIDGAVRATAAATVSMATGSRLADDVAIDGVAVEGGARLTGLAGRASRQLQTGLAHHYYVIMTVGVAAAIAVLLLFL